MVDIIKLEDLTLDEITSRIKSLDPAFTENNFFFLHMLIRVQHDFEDCLAECAKIIEGE